jgi:hypothetical protein
MGGVLLGCKPFCTGEMHALMAQRHSMLVQRIGALAKTGALTSTHGAIACPLRARRVCAEAHPQLQRRGADPPHCQHACHCCISAATSRRPAAGSPRPAVRWSFVW